MSNPVTWKQLVADALRELGGEASLKDITAKLAENPQRPETSTWQATIRRVVRQYKIFEPITTSQGLAGYRLVKLETPELKTGKKEDDPHGEQQGMLLQLGVFCGYETFTNSTDKTIRHLGGEPISKFATVRNDTEALAALPLAKMRQTDVMWMTEDSEGLYPRYAFEIEESTRVKSGLLRLLRIPDRYNVGLYIVGPGEEEAVLFRRYLNESPFRQHARRFHFHTYDEVRQFFGGGLAFDTQRKYWAISLAGRGE
jgi:hypothetical protein